MAGSLRDHNVTEVQWKTNRMMSQNTGFGSKNVIKQMEGQKLILTAPPIWLNRKKPKR